MLLPLVPRISTNSGVGFFGTRRFQRERRTYLPQIRLGTSYGLYTCILLYVQDFIAADRVVVTGPIIAVLLSEKDLITICDKSLSGIFLFLFMQKSLLSLPPSEEEDLSVCNTWDADVGRLVLSDSDLPGARKLSEILLSKVSAFMPLQRRL